MVGSMKVAVDFGALARDWAAYENPVQCANNNVRSNAPPANGRGFQKPD